MGSGGVLRCVLGRAPVDGPCVGLGPMASGRVGRLAARTVAVVVAAVAGLPAWAGLASVPPPSGEHTLQIGVLAESSTPWPARLELEGGRAFAAQRTVTAVVVPPSGAVDAVCVSAARVCEDWRGVGHPLAVRLPAGPGPHTVWAWFRSDGVELGPITASIAVDDQPPSPPEVSVAVESGGVMLDIEAGDDVGAGVLGHELRRVRPGDDCLDGVVLAQARGAELWVDAAVWKPVVEAGDALVVCAVDGVGHRSRPVELQPLDW